MSESKKRFTPANPGPVAVSFAKYVSEKHGVAISPKQAQALFTYHDEWQGSPERKAEREAAKAEREAARQAGSLEKLLANEDKLRAQLAAIEAARAAEVEAQKSA